jgi:hypothetical protein
VGAFLGRKEPKNAGGLLEVMSCMNNDVGLIGLFAFLIHRGSTNVSWLSALSGSITNQLEAESTRSPLGFLPRLY